MKLKGTGTRKATSPETEPNLYAYPYLPAESKDKNEQRGTANAPLGTTMAGLSGVGGGSGLANLDRLMQATAPVPNAAALQLQQNSALGGLGPLSALSGFATAADPLLVAQARTYALLALQQQVPGMGALGGGSAAALLNAGLFPQVAQTNPLLASQDIALRLALLRNGPGLSQDSITSNHAMKVSNDSSNNNNNNNNSDSKDDAAE